MQDRAAEIAEEAAFINKRKAELENDGLEPSQAGAAARKELAERREVQWEEEAKAREIKLQEAVVAREAELKEFRDKNNKIQEDRESLRQAELREKNQHDMEKKKASEERDQQKKAVFTDDKLMFKKECQDAMAQAIAARKRVRTAFQSFEDRDKLVASVYKSGGLSQ